MAGWTFAAILLPLVMSAAWVLARWTKNTAWIDAFWTCGTGVAAVAMALSPWSALSGRRWLVACLVATWATRLGGHLVGRALEHGDDARYRAKIAAWGPAAGRRLYVFLLYQAAAGVGLAGVIGLAARNPAALFRPGDIAAVIVFAVGVVGEAVADRQLRHFRHRAARGAALLDHGLWGWSRHPNYFFEWLCWLAYPLLAIDPTGGNPFGLLAVLAPGGMYWLLAHVSGIPPLEAHLAATRGAPFDEYRRRTSRFFPWPPLN